MRKSIITFSLIAGTTGAFAQGSPAISSWLQNTTVKGRHYVSGNSTPINDNSLTANVQSVKYSANYVYATTQNAIFKFPLNPVQNTGTPTATSGGNIGVFINGIAMFDYRDGVSWKSS